MRGGCGISTQGRGVSGLPGLLSCLRRQVSILRSLVFRPFLTMGGLVFGACAYAPSCASSIHVHLRKSMRESAHEYVRVFAHLYVYLNDMAHSSQRK